MLKYIRLGKKPKKIEWLPAPDIKDRISSLQQKLQLEWLALEQISSFRSTGAKTRAYARIWGLGKIWQLALGTKPHYIVEVIAEKFDGLSEKDKREVLLHELAHIPKNFSGALMPHFRRGKNKFHDKVKGLIVQYEEA